MRTCRWLAALAFLGLVVPAFAQDKPVTLKWKFEKDKTFYQEMKTETVQNMKVMGSDVKQTQVQTFYFSWTPKSQEADGSWVIEQEILAVKMDIDIGGSKIAYDSTKEGTSGPLGDFFKALVGSKFKVTVDKNMKVTKVEGRDDFLKKLVAANPQMEPLLKQILSEDALKEMAEPTFGVVPAQEVKKGQSWERKSSLDMGPIGKYENSFKYTYDGMQDKLDKIKVETSLKYVPPTDAVAGAGSLPFKIKSADLKSTNGTGVILFDNTLGRVVSSDMSLDLEGKLSIEIGGQTTVVELKQTQKTSVKTLTENPITAKPK